MGLEFAQARIGYLYGDVSLSEGYSSVCNGWCIRLSPQSIYSSFNW